MSGYIIRRFLQMIVIMCIVSIVSFIVIQLPPGDFVDAYVSTIAGGETVTQETIDGLRRQFGLDEPFIIQYFSWIGNVLRGNLGISFQHQRHRCRLTQRTAPPDACDYDTDCNSSLSCCDPNWHLFGSKSVFIPRLLYFPLLDLLVWRSRISYLRSSFFISVVNISVAMWVGYSLHNTNLRPGQWARYSISSLTCGFQ